MKSKRQSLFSQDGTWQQCNLNDSDQDEFVISLSKIAEIHLKLPYNAILNLTDIQLPEEIKKPLKLFY